MSQADRWFDVLQPYIVRGPNSRGEFTARCPIHDDKNPSASFNFKKGVWNCLVCGGGTLPTLCKRVKRMGNVVNMDVKRKASGRKVPPLTEAKVQGWHEVLMADQNLLRYLTEDRALDVDTIIQYQVGYNKDDDRYTIPIRDADEALVNVRRYKRDADTSQKMWNWPEHGSPARLWPLDQLNANEILVVEGEWDALACISHGFAAVTGTHGAKTWHKEWSGYFGGKNVYVSFDNDKEGRTGATTIARTLITAGDVAILPPLTKKPKSDATDYFVGGGTPEGLRKIMSEAKAVELKKPDQEPMEAVPVQVIGSMDSRTNGKPLTMNVTVTGVKRPTYSIPSVVQAECTMDYGDKCKACPMYLDYEGEHTHRFPTVGPAIAKELCQFIDATESKRTDLIRQAIGTPKCPKLELDVQESLSVEEVFVASSIDSRSEEGVDYTVRRVYNFGKHETEANTTARLVGTTWPSPKDSRNEFYAWELTEAQTSIDSFEMTPELYKELLKFQPVRNQRPIDKCRDIAHDMSENVTHIYGRDRMHIAMDLVYHSVLQIPLDGKVLTRGWLELIVVGDTRTGKSETAIRLAGHYGLGHVVGCEGATFAGLVGAVKQVANEWTVQWGEITVNDRRLVVLDEASGLSQDIIGQLSDIRSRGEAQLTKAESQQTRARTRLIWISNPRKGRGVDEKLVDGIDILDSLIGNPEDIARFDFAMSVRTNDVPMGSINNPDQSMGEPFYTGNACRQLILWAWSRKASDIVWAGESYRLVYKAADWLGGRYVAHPPLVQGTNIREKIARMAAAIACRTFSTDATGQQVIITEDHVQDAAEFIDKLYSYENFGYRRLSKRIHRNREIARQNRRKIKKWLRENPRLLEFLLDRRGSFRAQDLEEMAYMHRDEVNHVLGKLSDAKMIVKDKSQIVMEPELQALLKEMER